MTAATLALNQFVRRFDRVILAMIGIYAVLAVFAPAQVPGSLVFVGDALWGIAPFFLLSVAIGAAARATGSDKLISRIFAGRETQMIFAAAAFGALSPFCSCGVIPIVAALLVAGVPLAPVLAFCVSSPLMDPQMFILTAAQLGVPFAVGKTVAAIAIGLLGGFGTRALQRAGLFANSLKVERKTSCCCKSGAPAGPEQEPVRWDFWREPERNRLFGEVAWETTWFLGRWLTLAFIIESLMLVYVPADFVGRWLGDTGWWAIPIAAVVGVPAYLNGFAAIPVVAGLVDMGMARGAAMTFMIAGGVTSVPAAMAVFALVRKDVFLWYLVIAMIGSLSAGLAYQLAIAL